MLKFTEQPKTPGMTSKKTLLSLKEISRFYANLDETKADMVQFTRDGIRNGFSNIKETFAEILQLQMSVLHQGTSIFQSCRSLKFI